MAIQKETVIIGCKLPAGLILEIGLQRTQVQDGKLIPVNIRTENYQRIVIKGWHAHTEAVRRQGIQLPAGMDMSPFLNRNIPKSFWEKWKEENPKSWLIKNEILFEAKDEASAQLRKVEGDNTPSILAPIDRNKHGKNKPVHDIETADFALEKDRG